MEHYGFLRTPIWEPEERIKSKLFKDVGRLQPMKLEYLDIPHVYYSTAAGFDFIYALKETDDLSLFALKSVQIMIDEHSKFWDKLNFWCFGFPMVIQLSAFWYWSNIVIVNLEKDHGVFDL